MNRGSVGSLVMNMDNKLVAFVALDQRSGKGTVDEYHRAKHAIRIENVVGYYPCILPGRRWSIEIPF
jgi:hypothetical protein